MFIGILDPNQGVRGKGLWELQTNKIDVELFPPELASEIRSLNVDFIRFQQSLGIRITNVKDQDVIRTWDKGGGFEIEGTYENPPGDDTFGLVDRNGRWSFQPHSLKLDETRKQWSTKFYFGEFGAHTLYIVKASELGTVLANYYRQAIDRNIQRTKKLRSRRFRKLS